MPVDPAYEQLELHMEIERLQQHIVKRFVKQLKTHRERLVRDYEVGRILKDIKQHSAKVLNLYHENQPQYDTEQFYHNLKVIKDDYRRNINISSFTVKLELNYEQELETLFTGEEAFGRALDLNRIFNLFLNLNPSSDGEKTTTYLNFIRECDNFLRIPLATKKAPPYAPYLVEFQHYLEEFFARAMPLFDLESLKLDKATEFAENWLAGTVAGFEKTELPFNSQLYCTPCQKQFTNTSIHAAHFQGKKHLKAVKNTQAPNAQPPCQEEPLKAVAFAESMIKAYFTVLDTIRRDTFMRVEAKSMLTDTERQAMIDEEEEQVDAPLQSGDKGDGEADDDDDDDIDEKIYNPLKLPLGWDGKPIPYWLYKLHGLGVEYPCEICGGYVYMGRKAFDSHFTEWRHGHGLKSLGLINGKSLRGVTGIQDAFAVAEKIAREQKEAYLSTDVIEEFEDANGNVYNKKTFEDLKRQGLI